ncbi:hypothetical protein Tco_0186296 [Tanacetum coccineum]
MASVSSDNSSSTNEIVNTAHSVSIASSKDQASAASYVNDVMFSFFANQFNSPQLDYEDLEQIDDDDLEEMDLKWQVAMLTMRVKRFIKKIGRKMDLNDKETVGFDRTKRWDRWLRVEKHSVEEGITNFVVMAYTSQGSSSSSSSSSSNSEVHTCSKDCLNSYETLQKQYDQQCKALNKSNIEIIGYQMGLESLEVRIVVHEKNEAVYEEILHYLSMNVQVKRYFFKDLKISAKDKVGLGYDSQINKSEVVHSVFNSRESDVDDSLVNDRFNIGKGFHAVPPPYTVNYMPSRPDLSFAGLDDSVYKTKESETITTASKTNTDSDNDSVFRPKTDQTKPKFTKINFVKSDENVKSINKENTHRQEEYPRKSQSPRDNRRNWNGMMTQKLGNGFELTKKACFVCGSFNHLIKDCDFHDKKMVEKPVLNNKGRVTGQRENRLVCNNAQRVNHQNKCTHPHPKRNLVPTTVLTKSQQVPVNTAK